MDKDERRLLRAFRRRAGRAVGLVADNEVEVRLMGRSRVERALGGNDLRKRLVGREDDAEAPVRLRHQVERTELADDLVHVRDGGEGEILDREAAVVRRPALLGNVRVGTDAHRAEGPGGVGRPLVERLAEERDGGDEEKDESGWFHFILRNLERGVGLARAAGHDQLAAIMRLEMPVRGGDGLRLDLVLHRVGLEVRTQRPLSAMRPGLYGRPVHGRGGEFDQADLHHGRHLVLKRRFGVCRPAVRRRDPEPARKAARLKNAVREPLGRSREEGVDRLLGNAGIGGIALALHGPVVARDGLGDKVDAEVMTRTEVGTIREVAPKPDVRKQAFVFRQRQQIGTHQPLELRALLRLRKRFGAVTRQQLVEIRHFKPPSVFFIDNSVDSCRHIIPFPPSLHYVRTYHPPVRFEPRYSIFNAPDNRSSERRTDLVDVLICKKIPSALMPGQS